MFFLIEYVFSHLLTMFFAKYISIFCQMSQLIDREYICSSLFFYLYETYDWKQNSKPVIVLFSYPNIWHIWSYLKYLHRGCQICLDITANELLFLIYFRKKIFWPQTNYNFSCWPNPKQKVSNEISITRKLEMRLKCTIDMKYIWPIYHTNHLPIVEKLYMS